MIKRELTQQYLMFLTAHCCSTSSVPVGGGVREKHWLSSWQEGEEEVATFLCCCQASEFGMCCDDLFSSSFMSCFNERSYVDSPRRLT